MEMEKDLSLLQGKAVEALGTLLEGYISGLDIAGRGQESLLEEGSRIGECIKDILFAVTFLPVIANPGPDAKGAVEKLMDSYFLFKDYIRWMEEKLEATKSQAGS
jgi:hypothetical protein